MKLREFPLKAFPGEKNGPDIRITGSVGRRAGTLSIRYAISGDLSIIAIPAPGNPPKRKDRLWEETCLEFFLGVHGSEGYWEVNLSPAGHWNVYRFTRYRDGMREEPAFASLPFNVRIEPEALRLSLDLEIAKIIPARSALEVGVGAVIKTFKGETSHWALVHPGPRPDFHRRDGFRLNVPP